MSEKGLTCPLIYSSFQIRVESFTLVLTTRAEQPREIYIENTKLNYQTVKVALVKENIKHVIRQRTDSAWLSWFTVLFL